MEDWLFSVHIVITDSSVSHTIMLRRILMTANNNVLGIRMVGTTICMWEIRGELRKALMKMRCCFVWKIRQPRCK